MPTAVAGESGFGSARFGGNRSSHNFHVHASLLVCVCVNVVLGVLRGVLALVLGESLAQMFLGQ